jgi:hypothetical protein
LFCTNTLSFYTRWRSFVNRALLCKSKKHSAESKTVFYSFMTMNKRQQATDFCPVGQGTKQGFSPAEILVPYLLN